MMILKVMTPKFQGVTGINFGRFIEVATGKPFFKSRADPGRTIGAITPPKTYKSNFFHHGFVQLGKQHL